MTDIVKWPDYVGLNLHGLCLVHDLDLILTHTVRHILLRDGQDSLRVHLSRPGIARLQYPLNSLLLRLLHRILSFEGLQDLCLLNYGPVSLVNGSLVTLLTECRGRAALNDSLLTQGS